MRESNRNFSTLCLFLCLILPLTGHCVSSWDDVAGHSTSGGVSAANIINTRIINQSSFQQAAYRGQTGLEMFRTVKSAPQTTPLLPERKAAVSEDVPIDKVLVVKSLKKLYLLHDGAIFKEYPIALGKNPVGHKQEEGDGRTPEGNYVLDWRNSESKFYRSIHISYPNQQDIDLAKSAHRNPGKYIMIHGSPAWVPSVEWAKKWLYKEDWTDGCIAVTNDIMDELWQLVQYGTPIEIRP